ncbi:MAG: YicC family protein [Myxococcales bacterium]|nr:YicC family protein [Myxococcales bacterium]
MTDSSRAPGLRSMTGFGSASFTISGLAFEVEIRTVNHRHLDLRLKLPRQFASCEADARARVSHYLGRGKVDLSVNLAAGTRPTAELEIDEHVAGQYVDAAYQLSRGFEVTGALDVTALIAMPGVTRFVEPGLEESELSQVLCDAIDRALVAVDHTRLTEGNTIRADFENRLALVSELIEKLDSRSGVVRQSVKDRLRKRAGQLELETGLVDEARLHQEIVIAADRLDVSEEIARLRSHLEQFHAILASAGPAQMVGRRLDFLLQELGREANTVGSKANDAPLAHDVVEVKTELERIREQVQNCE